ncbi:uncharacterized protein A4U43_C07F8170 [Asparagus officinalis]|uniref:Uncharacterized protein n=1 Tax=Asparagus officinalis TaxID=4686 RepID=A0A5P1EFE5_ASPOF|nr:uncharacterized protein A4U43_C07F8170 [Asparagus officinalis]
MGEGRAKREARRIAWKWKTLESMEEAAVGVENPRIDGRRKGEVLFDGSVSLLRKAKRREDEKRQENPVGIVQRRAQRPESLAVVL